MTTSRSKSVLITRTYWAPGCAEMRSGDNHLHLWMLDADSQAVLWRVIELLEKSPGSIALRSFGNDTEVLARPEAGADPVVMASISGDFTFSNLLGALRDLRGSIADQTSEAA